MPEKGNPRSVRFLKICLRTTLLLQPKMPQSWGTLTFSWIPLLVLLELSLKKGSTADIVRKRRSVHTLLFTTLVPLHPPVPTQQSDGSPLEFVFKGPQAELRTIHQNCEQTSPILDPELRTNRTVIKRALLNFERR